MVSCHDLFELARRLGHAMLPGATRAQMRMRRCSYTRELHAKPLIHGKGFLPTRILPISGCWFDGQAINWFTTVGRPRGARTYKRRNLNSKTSTPPKIFLVDQYPAKEIPRQCYNCATSESNWAPEENGMSTPVPSEITQLLLAWSEGDRSALEQLDPAGL